MQTDMFRKTDIRAASVQNHMTANINPKMIANQLAPVAREMARNGEMPFALVTMTQELNNRMISSQPQQVFYPPQVYSFNQAAALRHKTF